MGGRHRASPIIGGGLPFRKSALAACKTLGIKRIGQKSCQSSLAELPELA